MIWTVTGVPFRTALVFAFLFSIAFWFYSVFWATAPVMAPDSWSYLTTAQDLADFRPDQLQLRTPGYPLLLVLTGSSQTPNRGLFFVSLLLHFASIWLLASVLYRAGLREIMLILFGFILLLPPYVESAAYVLTENLTEAMLVAGLVSFIYWSLHKKTIWILIATVSIGSAALTRPTYQFLAFAMAGYLMMARFLVPLAAVKWRDVVKTSLVLTLGSIVIVGGYALINYRTFGYFGVTPRFGLTLSTKTWRFFERLPDEYASTRAVLIRARNAQLVQQEGEHDGSMAIWAAVPELTKITGLEYKQLSDYMLKINLLLIRKAPLNYLREVIWAFGAYWFPSSTTLANFNSRSVQFLWAALHFLLMAAFAANLIVIAGAAIYLGNYRQVMRQHGNVLVNEFRLIKFQGLTYGLAATIVFYTAVVSCLVEVGNPRYRIPTDGLILFMLFLGTHLLSVLVKSSRTLLFR